MESFVSEIDSTGLHPDDFPGVISDAIDEVMNDAKTANHDDLSGYTITIIFIPSSIENVLDEVE
jgi:hypothetical protein